MSDVLATWKPDEDRGRLSTHSNLPDSVFAFPNQRKEPLTDAQYVRSAVARSIKSSMCPKPIESSLSRISRRLRSTTM
jgi:hypothetical protein